MDFVEVLKNIGGVAYGVLLVYIMNRVYTAVEKMKG